MPPQLALIADDLTGALDAGAGFVRAGLRAVLPFSGAPADADGADVVLLNTASREAGQAVAIAASRRAAEAVRAAGIARVYKKIDSVLRGYPGAELAAVLDVIGGRAVVAPAFPAQGRVTRHGVQYVHGRPVEPYVGDVRAALDAAAGRSDIWDAETDADLQRIAALAAAEPDYRVWCGSAGLAACAPAALRLRRGQDGQRPTAPPAGRLVVVAGTDHPATAAQIAALRAAGWPVLPLDIAEPVPHDLAARVAAALGAAATGCVLFLRGHVPPSENGQLPLVVELLRTIAAAVSQQADAGLILTGGETALYVCRALGARAIEVTGEALPGIPIGVLRLPETDVAVATKSGGFGDPDALLQTAHTLLPRTPVEGSPAAASRRRTRRR